MTASTDNDSDRDRAGVRPIGDGAEPPAPGPRSLPVLDLSRLDRGTDEAEAFRLDLRNATHEVGFFLLVGHGIEPAVTDRLFRVAQEFFALSDADKLAIEMTRSPHFRGYTRLGGELTRGQVDWREQIDLAAERDVVTPGPGRPDYLRLEGPNQWPAALPQLREVVTDWQQRLTEISLRLLQEWAVCLGADRHLFDGAFAATPATLTKIIRYPGRDDEASGQGVGAHKDPGVLTLLLVEPGRAGLQVEHQGSWIEVPPLEGAFVVNIGELLEVATDGYLKATSHRVLSPPAGTTRISIPFFFNPSLSSTIPAVTLPPELAAAAVGVTADPDNVISGTFGENLLKARLRAHPDVARRHHRDLVGG